MDNRTFGQQLKILRDRARHPTTGRPPARETLALEVGQLLEQSGAKVRITPHILADIETDTRPIRADEWPLLLTLLDVLYDWHGFETLAEANALLAAANLRPLSPAEAARLNPAWGGLGGAPGRPAESPEQPGLRQPWPPAIPNEPYFRLPERDLALDDVAETLLTDGGARVAVIDGMGGLGKTAVAVELAHRLLARGEYAAVLGESARLEVLSLGEIIGVREAVLDFGGLLDSLARQLKRWDLTTAPLDEKIARLTQVFTDARYLLIVDNLETAANADEIGIRLKDMLGSSQALLTTRRKVSLSNALALPLDGLKESDALVYLRAEAEAEGIAQLQGANETQLLRLARLTGGAILAMKLLAAQARTIDLNVLINAEHTGSGPLYRFIYYRSWQQLSSPAQKILIHIGRAAAAPVGRRELAQLEIAEDESDLSAALTQLAHYSLLAVHRGGSSLRYGIHPLTRQFINSDLPEIWREQGWRSD